MQAEEDSSEESLCTDKQQENVECLDTNLLGLVFSKVFQQTAQRCCGCRRPLIWEIRNTEMMYLQLVNRHWLRAWKACCMHLMTQYNGFCTNPAKCLRAYMKSIPRIPMLLVNACTPRQGFIK